MHNVKAPSLGWTYTQQLHIINWYGVIAASDVTDSSSTAYTHVVARSSHCGRGTVLDSFYTLFL
jgi:hypothetical protein